VRGPSLARRGIRRCSSWSTSFVLAALLRALHVDRSHAPTWRAARRTSPRTHHLRNFVSAGTGNYFDERQQFICARARRLHPHPYLDGFGTSALSPSSPSVTKLAVYAQLRVAARVRPIPMGCQHPGSTTPRRRRRSVSVWSPGTRVGAWPRHRGGESRIEAWLGNQPGERTGSNSGSNWGQSRSIFRGMVAPVSQQLLAPGRYRTDRPPPRKRVWLTATVGSNPTATANFSR
jgi:hypothetical protein